MEQSDVGGPLTRGRLLPFALESRLGRIAARAVIAVGACVMAAAFLLRVDGASRVGVLLAGTTILELGGLIAIRTRGPITALRGRAPGRAYLAAVLVAAA